MFERSLDHLVGAQQGCPGGYRNHAAPHVSLKPKPQREFSSGKNFVNPNAFNSAGR